MRPLPRRQARETALQVLYFIDANPELSPGAALAMFYDRFAVEAEHQDDDEAGGDPEQPETSDAVAGVGVRVADISAADTSLVEALVRGVTEHRAAIDERLSQLSRNWRLERIARVERNILRLALFELEHRDDIPARVTLNEAIELAKKFGAADASAFVNGILDSALHDRDRPGKAEE
jgi:N utilization substance protein B